MNKENNIRAQQTKQKIERALMYLLERKSFSQIFVKDICTIACINRSSFYEHYQDINDLMMKIESGLSAKMAQIFNNPPYYSKESFIKMFEFIKEHQVFYKAYLSNSDGSMLKETDFFSYYKTMRNNVHSTARYTEKEMMYHMAFFSAGIMAMCKVWLLTDTKESPEELAAILFKEYKDKIDML